MSAHVPQADGRGATRPCVVIAGGGTGGHVFPGIAVAERLLADHGLSCIFVGTARGIEARVVPEAGFSLRLIRATPMVGGGVFRVATGARDAVLSLADSMRILRESAPLAVLSVGGYAAGPVSLSARALGIPLFVFEPNRVPGLTNRILAPLSTRAYVTWEETATYFRKGRSRVLGVPLRKGFRPSPYTPDGSRRRILVLGGSHGAAIFNERAAEVFQQLEARLGPSDIVHQAGRGRAAKVQEDYDARGVQKAVITEFLDDVEQKLAWADVVMARAGAGTVAEICAVGRASVLVPFPYAAADHQAHNAFALADRGGAIAMRQEVASTGALVDALGTILTDPERRVAMSQRARELGHPDAATEVARDLVATAAGERATRKYGRADAGSVTPVAVKEP